MSQLERINIYLYDGDVIKDDDDAITVMGGEVLWAGGQSDDSMPASRIKPPATMHFPMQLSGICICICICTCICIFICICICIFVCFPITQCSASLLELHVLMHFPICKYEEDAALMMPMKGFQN